MFAQVIVDITHTEVDKIFEYSYSSDQNVRIGNRVTVPFGNKTIEGIVIGIQENSVYPIDKIKPIVSIIEDTPVLTEETLKLTEYICDTCYVTRAQALRLFLPSEMRKGRIKEKFATFIDLADGVDVDQVVLGLRKTAKNQKDLLYYLSENGKVKQSILSEKFSLSSIKSLLEKGVLVATEEKNYRLPYKNLENKKKVVNLTPKQLLAVQSIKNTDKTTTLLYGVTGSGKTEVYLNLIDQTIKDGKTAIMLVPEISLTPQMFSQLRARFGDNAAILHSGLSAGERFDEWWRLRNGEANIAIGARSAIFAPLKNVGIIIIDEEHDGSYQSESSPRYVTMDVAKFRARYNNAKLVVGSATPSIETFMRASNGEYNLCELPDRVNKKPMPEVEIVDMRAEVRRGNNTLFSSAIKEELKTCLDNGNQAIIFLNQRGYSRNVVCTECGHVQKCESCDVSLTYHKEDNSLLCHYCGAKYKMISACTECGSKFLRYGGTGTERVVDDLKKLFPNARILRMDRDTTQNKESHLEILSKFAKREADILVGTQMIAKGHDFPQVTLVGILDGDMSLHFSDYRSGERTFQLITQVAGRCGRAEAVGRVVLQTYSPENPVLRQAINYDYENFFNRELSVRKATGFPPFTDIVRVLLSGENESETLEITQKVHQEIKKIYDEKREQFRFFGTMKAPIKRLQNKFRYQVLMRIKAGNKAILDKINEICLTNSNRKTSIVMEINSNNLT